MQRHTPGHPYAFSAHAQLPQRHAVGFDGSGHETAAADTDPSHAPFPQWSPTAPYPAGYKIVHEGSSTQAKWYNFGDDPVTQVRYSATRWDLLARYSRPTCATTG